MLDVDRVERAVYTYGSHIVVGTELLIHSEYDSTDEVLRSRMDCNRKSMREREHMAMTLMLLCEFCHTVSVSP